MLASNDRMGKQDSRKKDGEHKKHRSKVASHGSESDGDDVSSSDSEEEHGWKRDDRKKGDSKESRQEKERRREERRVRKLRKSVGKMMKKFPLDVSHDFVRVGLMPMRLFLGHVVFSLCFIR